MEGGFGGIFRGKGVKLTDYCKFFHIIGNFRAKGFGN